MTLNELAVIIERAIGNGHGEAQVVYGDVNGYVRAGSDSVGIGFVEDPSEYIMEPCDEDCETATKVFVITE